MVRIAPNSTYESLSFLSDAAKKSTHYADNTEYLPSVWSDSDSSDNYWGSNIEDPDLSSDSGDNYWGSNIKNPDFSSDSGDNYWGSNIKNPDLSSDSGDNYWGSNIEDPDLSSEGGDVDYNEPGFPYPRLGSDSTSTCTKKTSCFKTNYVC